MEAHEVEDYLYEHIPLARALGLRVVHLDDSGTRLRAPLGPNVNHRGSGFGGSLSAIGILAGWALVHARMRREALDPGLVIQRHQVDFEAPAEGALEAWAPTPPSAAWEAFLRAYRRRGRARIDVSCELHSAGRRIGGCRGRYVALGGGT